MTGGSSHHDHTEKTLLGRPAIAGILLRERLPPEIVDLMSPDSPVLLFYRIGLRSGGSALALVLIEHDGRGRPTSAVLSKFLRWIALTGGDFRRRLLALATDEVYRDDRIVQLFIYMINVYTDLDRPTLDMLTAPMSKAERDEVATMAQRLYADGKADGRAEGKTEPLLEMLEYRFGPVPSEVRSHVSRLDPGSITLMVRRAMEAASLEQVLNPRKD